MRHVTIHLVAGFVLALAVAAMAYRARALDTSGAVAAIVTGTLAVAAGWSWALVLIGYFVSASLWSRYRAAEKEVLAGERAEKHGARDALQVVANGGVFAALALGQALRPDGWWHVLAAGALAASAADTWATEIGVLAPAQPRSMVTWKPVPVGTSGGVTMRGSLAGVAGALFVALAVWQARWPHAASVAALAGGVAGCWLDSLLGATLQSRRWCASCRAATEQRIHRCGTATVHTGGFRWLDNDGVNALATLGGAMVGASIGLVAAR